MSLPFLPFEDLIQIIDGRWLVPPSWNGNAGVRGIFDDSRKVMPGVLFVAIAGEVTDGHRYVAMAAEKGASAIVVQQRPSREILEKLAGCKCACCMVDSSLRAYQLLARWHRMQFPDTKIVAVTGSCGKTSTKEFCAAMLEEHFPGQVKKTIGSTNNHFGVPRNLLDIDEGTKVAVIELGSNHPGEIAGLVSMVQPDVSLVCSIGHAHLEFFHDLEGVACEKGDIYCGTRMEGSVVVPLQAPHSEVLLKKAGLHRIMRAAVNDDSADVSARYDGFRNQAFRVTMHWKKHDVTLSGPIAVGGRHAASNAACAACAVDALGVTPEECMAGLAKCVLPGERQKILQVGKVTVVNDAFNSNPDSARAAVDFFKEIVPQGQERALLLGDMLELGENSLQLHVELLDYVRRNLPGVRLAVVGDMMRKAVEGLGAFETAGIHVFADAESAATGFAASLSDGCWLLLKSSHGIGLAHLPSILNL